MHRVMHDRVEWICCDDRLEIDLEGISIQALDDNDLGDECSCKGGEVVIHYSE